MSALTHGVKVHAAPESFGSVRADIEVWIDFATLVRVMGARAATNQGGQTQLLHGAIIVRAINLTEEK
jgi:hypothetical protein